MPKFIIALGESTKENICDRVPGQPTSPALLLSLCFPVLVIRSWNRPLEKIIVVYP
jgi:hypothetical protein